jgi:hypothetical protein
MAGRRSTRKRDDIVVFSIVRESSCSECEAELGKGALLRMEDDRPLCLSCADLDHLVFLPSGDAALTRRSSKHSTLRAVVVRFSRTRKRYERQGVLVEQEALSRAEQECIADEDDRRLARVRAAKYREKEDAAYLAAFTKRLGELYPGCPEVERASIARHACAKYSARIGRTRAAKQLDTGAIGLAVRAHVRHAHTSYDVLLAGGGDRRESRRQVADDVARILEAWKRGASGGITSR